MKKILVLSDIHLSSASDDFPFKKINKFANDIDLVFGLGDYTDQKGLNNLYSFGKEVYAVSGNMDEHYLKANLPEKIIVKVGDVDIGLIHGWGSSWKIRNKLKSQFGKVDLICYGHTHSSFFDKELGIYFFNPGSLSGEFKSFGIITIDGNTGRKIDAEIVQL